LFLLVCRIFLNSLVTSLRSQQQQQQQQQQQAPSSPPPPDSGSASTSPAPSPSLDWWWSQALRDARAALTHYTPAARGDRTVVDALDPFVATLTATRDVQRAARAAVDGAAATVGMRPALGRSVYVAGGDAWKHVPDPGAYALSRFLAGLAGV
jgi:dihydroxyacetone kinase